MSMMGLTNCNAEPSNEAAILNRFIQRGGEIQFMEDETPATRVVPKPGGGFTYHVYGLALKVPESIRRRQKEEAAANAGQRVTHDSLNNYASIPMTGKFVSERRRPTITKATLKSKIVAKIQNPKKPGYVPILPKPPGLIPVDVPTSPIAPAAEDHDLSLGNLLNANDGYVPWRQGEMGKKKSIPNRVKQPEPEVINLSDSEEEKEDGNTNVYVEDIQFNPQTHAGAPLLDIETLESDGEDEFESGSAGGEEEKEEIKEEEEDENDGEFEGTKLLPWGESTISIPMGLELSAVEDDEEEEIFDEEEGFFEHDEGQEDFDEEDEVPGAENGEIEPSHPTSSTMGTDMLSDPTVGFEWSNEIENDESDDMKMQMDFIENVLEIKQENELE